MSTFYFDSLNGSDSNTGASTASPWANYELKKGANIFAGDKVFFKRGTTQIVNTQYSGHRGGSSAAAPTILSAYGEGPRPRWLYTGVDWGYIFNAAGLSNTVFEDQDFDGGGINNTIYLAAQGVGTVTNVTFRRSLFHNTGTKSGLTIAKESSATTASISGIVIEESDFYDCGEHGLISLASTGVRVRRSRAWNNGANAGTGGGHGFSSRWNRSDVTSGWTLVSGTTYKRTLTAAEIAENKIGYVQLNFVANRLRATENTVTPSVLATDEYGVLAGELYLNAGVNPNGTSVRYAFHRCANIIYEDCQAWSNRVNAASQFQEGNGFAFDDFTEDSRATRCRAWNNEGRGFSVNRGDRNIVEDSASWANGLTGLSSNTSKNSVIRRSTFVFNSIGNPLTPVLGTANEIYFSPQAQATITQSVLAANAGSQACIGDAVATITADKCSFSGAVAALVAVPTNTVAGAQLITAEGRPKAGSPLLAAGTHSGYRRDVLRIQRNKPPAIGAYDVASVVRRP